MEEKRDRKMGGVDWVRGWAWKSEAWLMRTPMAFMGPVSDSLLWRSTCSLQEGPDLLIDGMCTNVYTDFRSRFNSRESGGISKASELGNLKGEMTAACGGSHT